jgi:hypothetical protein
MEPDISARYVHGKPPLNPQENMGWLSIFGVLEAQQQESLIDPLKGTTCHSKYLNLGGEGNNHSLEPPKLHPMEIYVKSVMYRVKEIF